MKRGHILMNDNNYYMLVRVEAEVKGTDPNGSPSGTPCDRYNLVNLSTGKTRVSDPERMYLIPSTNEDVPLVSLREHFNLPDLTDTGIHISDMNFGEQVAQAYHDKKLRDSLNVSSGMSTDATLNACINVLRTLGINIQ